MAHDFDLVIRGGTVVDGTGGEPMVADVGISGPTIVAVGEGLGAGTEEVDARGHLVTPGFVDVHTHLDGHTAWGSRLEPCSGHGVTTAVFGNCGVGFAPARPADRETLINLMHGVEDIEPDVLRAGLPWEWETYPEYLDFLGGRRYDMDVGALVPHSALRVHVMGERGMDGEVATPDDVAGMATVAREAVAAGALGFATSRLTEQRAGDGRHIPSLNAAESELEAIACAMGRGVLQMAIEFNEFPSVVDELEMLVRVARHSGRPTMYSLKQCNRTPEGWRDLLDITSRANAEGVDIHPQVLGRPTGLVVHWDGGLQPFALTPTYLKVAPLPIERRVADLRRPEVRAAIVGEAAENQVKVRADFSNYFRFGEPPDYEPDPGTSVEHEAAQRGIDPLELIYDLMLERDGRGQLLCCIGNYAQGSLDPALEMMRFPGSVPGLGDGGAHSTVVCDASISTYMLTYWTRDRTRGDRLPLPFVVRWLTADCASAMGLHDRGTIAVGRKADLNVVDYDHLTLHAPRRQADLPAGGHRLVQDVDGYVATVVSGEIVRRDDQPTDALPGRLVRGRRPAGR
ncbi:MAG: amidohydrolase family protein [Acidimicrobiia bacterium]